MKRIQIDPMEFDGHSLAWPAHVYSKLKEAGFRLNPLPKIAPSGDDVMEVLLPPWQITKSTLHILSITQSD